MIGFEEINIRGHVGVPSFFNALFTNRLDQPMQYRLDLYKEIDEDPQGKSDGRLTVVSEQEELNYLAEQGILEKHSVQAPVSVDKIFNVLVDGLVLLNLEAGQSCQLLLKYLDLDEASTP